MNKSDHQEKLKKLSSEKFKIIKFEDRLKLRYAISNLGRLVSFADKIEFGRLINGSIIEGYRVFRYKIRVNDKISHKHKFFYRLVAEKFLKKTSDKEIYVLHLDHNLSNDIVDNLKWATKEEMIAHQQLSPKVIEARKATIKRLVELNKKERDFGNKLSHKQVKQIKTLLADPNRKISQSKIAKQFGISEMQLYRIKKGENWGYVKIEGQNTEIISSKPTDDKIKKIIETTPKEPTKLKNVTTWFEKFEDYQNGVKNDLITRWISYNRRLYKRGILPEDKLKKLVEINFSFEEEPKATKLCSWNRQFEEWKKGERKSEKIQRWRKRSIKQFIKGKLPKSRILKLKEIGILK